MILFLIFSSFLSALQAHENPVLNKPIITSSSKNCFDRIEITSKRATCSKKKEEPNLFEVCYTENTKVTFADGSFLKANELRLEFNKPIKNLKNECGKEKDFPLKKIHAKGNVLVCYQNKKITAQQAVCDVKTADCTFRGSVVFTQKAEKKSDIPLVTKGTEVICNFKTGKIQVVGTEAEPVSTIIEFKPQLQAKESNA